MFALCCDVQLWPNQCNTYLAHSCRPTWPDCLLFFWPLAAYVRGMTSGVGFVTSDVTPGPQWSRSAWSCAVTSDKGSHWLNVWEMLQLMHDGWSPQGTSGPCCRSSSALSRQLGPIGWRPGCCTRQGLCKVAANSNWSWPSLAWRTQCSPGVGKCLQLGFTSVPSPPCTSCALHTRSRAAHERLFIPLRTNLLRAGGHSASYHPSFLFRSFPFPAMIK